MHITKSGMPGKIVTTILTDYDDADNGGVERRVLRILSEDSYFNDYMVDYDKYLDYFQIKHPEIELQFVSIPMMIIDNRDQFRLRLMSGEMDVDIITQPSLADPFYFKSGLYRDLSGFPDIDHALNNPEMLEGFRENCTDSSGSVFGIPTGAYYSGYIINTVLFERTGLTLPEPDWTVDDFYALSIQVANRLNGGGEPKAYMGIRYKSNEDGEDTSYRYRMAAALDSPLIVGLNSSNGYAPQFDTPEMIQLMKRGKELYTLFPYINGYDNRDMSQSDPSLLFWRFDVLTPYGFVNRDQNASFTAEQQAGLLLPFPIDIYGNGRSPFLSYNTGFLSIYNRAKNPDDAALFITGFLDEDYQRANAQYFQMYRDASRYANMQNIPKSWEGLIALLTKRTSYNGDLANVDILRFYHTLESRYFWGELTAEEFARELQEGVERRMRG